MFGDAQLSEMISYDGVGASFNVSMCLYGIVAYVCVDQMLHLHARVSARTRACELVELSSGLSVFQLRSGRVLAGHMHGTSLQTGV